MGRTPEPSRGFAEAVSLDQHTIHPIPPGGRTSSPLHVFWIWMGANLAPINWILGGLGITFGLSLVETIVVVALSNLVGCAIFGLFSLMGHRTAVNQMVLSRSAFGVRGAYLPTIMLLLTSMGWIGVNTWVVLDLVLGILDGLGYQGGTGAKYLIGLAIMAIQVVIAIWGFYAIRTFEKWTVPLTAVVMLVMSVLVWSRIDVDWTASSAVGADKVSAISHLLTAVGIGWALSWITISADYARFITTRASNTRAFLGTALGMYVPTVWLAALGASLASTGAGLEPAQYVASVFGVMAIPVLFVVAHGPVATNILNIYSASVAFLSLGIRVPRWVVSAVVGVVGTLALALFISAESIAHAFDNWMTSIVMWTSAWGGVVFVDYYVLRRAAVETAELYRPPHESVFGDVNPRALVSFVAGLVAGWSCAYGLVPFMQGPVARLLSNSDFSWAAALFVSGALFYVLQRARLAREPHPTAEPPRGRQRSPQR